MANNITKRKRSTWRILGFGIVLSLIVTFLVVWYQFQGRARTELTVRLSELGLGEPEIGKVQTSREGLVVNDVSFPANESEGLPELHVDQIKFNQPLTDLIRGTIELESIDLKGVEISFPLARLQSFNTSSFFDLSSFKLPAKKINLQNASVTFTSPDYDDFRIDGINATLTSMEETIALNGSIHNFAGNELKISGQLSAVSREFAQPSASLWITSNAFRIEDGQWQAWPFLPKGIEKWVRADGEAAIDVNVELDEQQAATVTGSAALDQINMNLPSFELPIKISAGQIELDGDQLKFKNVVASTDESDRVKADGFVKIKDFPLMVNFSADFQDVTTTTLRKFVADLPETVRGRADGNVTGTVEIESDTSTILRLESEAISESTGYGQLISDWVKIATKISSLKFDN